MVEYTVEEQEDNEGLVQKLALYDANHALIKTYEIQKYDEITDNYESEMEQLQNDSKQLKANKKIELELNDKKNYQIVSISEI